MNSIKSILKFFLITIGLMIAAVYLDKQPTEVRPFFGIGILILGMAWLGQKRFDQLSKEKLYHCTFEKDIIASDRNEVLASLVLEHPLPFAPYLGLEVVDQKNPPGENADLEEHDFQAFYTGKIKKICWRYNRFVCEVEPYKMAPENDLGAVMADHISLEWKWDGLRSDAGKKLKIYLSELEKKMDRTLCENRMVEKLTRNLKEWCLI